MRKKWFAAVMACMVLTGCAQEGNEVTETTDVIVSMVDTTVVDTTVDTEVQEQAAEGTIAEQVEAPERYAVSFKQGALQVNVDAEVEVPDGDGFRRWSVMARAFTQEDLDAVHEVILEDAVLWQYDEETLSALQAQFAGQMSMLIEEKNLLEQEGADTSKVEQEITELQKQSTEVVATKTEVEALMPSAGEDAVWQARADVGGKEYGISISNEYTEEDHQVDLNVYLIGDDYEAPEDNFSTSQQARDNAQAKAEDYMTRMGLADFAAACEEYVFYAPENEETGEREVKDMCWRISYTRVLDGIPVTYTQHLGNGAQAGTWSYERVQFTFNAAGDLIDFEWSCPYDEVEPVGEETVFLLPFSEIADIFEKTIALGYDTDEDAELVIESVQLGYMRVLSEAGDTTGTMVPVWDFFGYYRSLPSDGTGTATGNSLLTINATDGTVIDRDLGY